MNMDMSSESVTSLMPALAKAIGEMPDVDKKKEANVPTRSGGSYSFKYADIADVLKTAKPTLAKHDLFLMQDHRTTDAGVEIKSIVFHSSGEWIASDWLLLPVDAHHAQALGSAMTYGRRYSAGTFLGMATEEDDGGESARTHNQNRRVQPDANRTTPPTPTTENDKGKAVKAITEWSGVGQSEVVAAIRDVVRAAGVEVEEGKNLTDAQWSVVLSWVSEQMENGVDFADAVATEKESK